MAPETEIYERVQNNYLAYLIEKWLIEKAHSVEEIAEKIKQEVDERRDASLHDLKNEVKGYLLCGIFAKKNGKRRYRPRIHVFVRGLQGLVRCSNPDCGEIYNDGKTICPKCGSLTYPLEVCRNCGQDFLKTSFSGKIPSILIPNDAFDSDEYTMHITHKIQHLYSEDSEGGSPFNVYYFCPKCGMLSISEEPSKECKHEYTKVYGVRGKILECPACFGRYGNREVVTPVKSGQASDTTVLTTTLFSDFEEPERKTLIFSDNRQDAAHQAGYMEDRHIQFTIRQLLYQITKNRDIPLSIKRAAEGVWEKGISLGIFDRPQV